MYAKIHCVNFTKNWDSSPGRNERNENMKNNGLFRIEKSHIEILTREILGKDFNRSVWLNAENEVQNQKSTVYGSALLVAKSSLLNLYRKQYQYAILQHVDYLKRN